MRRNTYAAWKWLALGALWLGCGDDDAGAMPPPNAVPGTSQVPGPSESSPPPTVELPAPEPPTSQLPAPAPQPQSEGAPISPEPPAAIEPQRLALALQSGCAPPDFAGKITRASTDQVDLLLVVDDSLSMAAVAETVRKELPKLVARLLSGDMNQDGTSDLTAVRSLRIGLTTTDVPIVGVTDPKLLAPGTHCSSEVRPLLRKLADGRSFLELSPGDGRDVASELAALFPAPQDLGCAYEQPFEAALVALTDGTPFEDLTGRRVSYPAANFLRPDSVLAVLLVGDEDDCSAPPPHELIFPGPESEFYAVGPNIRCTQYRNEPGMLRTVDSFVSRLLALRGGIHSRVVFGAITGIAPQDSQKNAGDVLASMSPVELDYQGLDPSSPAAQRQVRLKPECRYVPAGAAEPLWVGYPAPRIVEAVARFGERGVIGSICTEQLAAPLTRTLDVMAESFQPMPRCE